MRKPARAAAAEHDSKGHAHQPPRKPVDVAGVIPTGVRLRGALAAPGRTQVFVEAVVRALLLWARYASTVRRVGHVEPHMVMRADAGAWLQPSARPLGPVRPHRVQQHELARGGRARVAQQRLDRRECGRGRREADEEHEVRLAQAALRPLGGERVGHVEQQPVLQLEAAQEGDHGELAEGREGLHAEGLVQRGGVQHAGRDTHLAQRLLHAVAHVPHRRLQLAAAAQGQQADRARPRRRHAAPRAQVRGGGR